MFEKYDIDRLYTCEIEVWIPWSIENIGGMVTITGEGIREYQTIVYEDNGRYIDIYHLDKIICDMSNENFNHNHICCSDDGYLYALDSYNLKKYSDGLSEKRKKAKTLQRLPFRKNRLLKK